MHCGNKRVLEVQSFGKAGIDVVFGLDGLGVQEDAGTLDLLGKALGGCRACGLTKDSGGDGLGSDFCGLGLVVADWRSDGLGVEGGRVDSGGRGSGLERAVVDGLARVLDHGVRRGK